MSDEGPIPNPRYPTNALPSLPPQTNAPAPTLQAKTNAPGLTSLVENPEFNERITSFTFDPEVKVRVNAPGQTSFAPGKKVLLIFYALPNGNTTDQTVGKVIAARR